MRWPSRRIREYVRERQRWSANSSPAPTRSLPRLQRSLRAASGAGRPRGGSASRPTAGTRRRFRCSRPARCQVGGRHAQHARSRRPSIAVRLKGAVRGGASRGGLEAGVGIEPEGALMGKRRRLGPTKKFALPPPWPPLCVAWQPNTPLTAARSARLETKTSAISANRKILSNISAARLSLSSTAFVRGCRLRRDLNCAPDAGRGARATRPCRNRATREFCLHPLRHRLRRAARDPRRKLRHSESGRPSDGRHHGQHEFVASQSR